MDKKFPASIDHLYDMLSFICSFVETLQASPELITKIELACEEALVNVIQYAYATGTGVIEIRCTEIPGRGVKIDIQDNGSPFNPLTEVKQVDVQAPITERKIGGYGIHLIRQIMDEVTYQRIDNYNVLTLVRYF